MKTDILIIGGGIAGLSTAIYLSEQNPKLIIDVMCKRGINENNTSYAQGGIASVWDNKNDHSDIHIQDTLTAGDGLCDVDIVKKVITQGPKGVNDLINWGTQFDHDGRQNYNLGIEGGHSKSRILHHKDITGREIHRALIAKIASLKNVKIHENRFIVDIITQHHQGRNVTRMSEKIECYGAYYMQPDSDRIKKCLAKITVMASGGAGECYRATTNPDVATGDGIAMVYRAKGRISNMEFIQFHPTSLYTLQAQSPSFLISEAVRGLGAVLVNKDGETFMHKYDSRGSLAPRDIVARAIDTEMNLNGVDHIFLDCTNLDKEEFINHFPNIYNRCLEEGLNPLKDKIPVVPAAHYTCGGIVTDSHAQTSIINLYAVGECTSTGLHGANRLASNSLLEGLVFAKSAADHIVKQHVNLEWQDDIPEWQSQSTTVAKEKVLLTQSLKELKQIMSFYVRIVRSDERLERALNRLNLLYQETQSLYAKSVLSPQLCELRNLITIGYLISRSAKLRKESRGLHYTSDYPEKNTRFIENTTL